MTLKKLSVTFLLSLFLGYLFTYYENYSALVAENQPQLFLSVWLISGFVYSVGFFLWSVMMLKVLTFNDKEKKKKDKTRSQKEILID